MRLHCKDFLDWSNLNIGLKTPKALANSSSGLERKRQPGDSKMKYTLTLKGLDGWRTLTGFNLRVNYQRPGLSLRSNPGLELANAFGVFQTKQYLAQ